MSRIFAWIAMVFSILMLVVQLGVAASPNLPVVGFWALVLTLCVYVLFLKKPKPVD